MSEKVRGRKGNGHKGKERRKGAGTLEKRGRIYFARWTVNGKRITRSTGTTDEREAAKRLAEFVAPFQMKNEAERLESLTGLLEGARGRVKAYEESRPALALSDAWDAFIKAPTRKDTAGAARLRLCESNYNKFVSWMAAKFPDVVEVRGVTKEQAHLFAVEGFEGLCNSTRNQAISFYRMMWRVLIEGGTARITVNPWDGIQKKQEQHTRRRELTVEELARVCGSLRGEMRMLFIVGIYTGLRLGDCAMLEWGQVDLLRGIIRLIPRKTKRKCNREVVMPIRKTLLAALLEIPPEQRTGYVMPECAATYTRESSNLSAHIQSIFKNAGIVTATDGIDSGRKRALVSFHSLRHTFVSMAANAGVPLAVVQAIVGHATAEMTRHYYHESSNALVAAVAALPDVIDGGTATAGAGVSARVRSVCAMLDGMTAEERGEVMRHLRGEGAAAVDVVALPCRAVDVPHEERQADNSASQSAAA